MRLGVVIDYIFDLQNRIRLLWCCRARLTIIHINVGTVARDMTGMNGHFVGQWYRMVWRGVMLYIVMCDHQKSIGSNSIPIG